MGYNVPNIFSGGVRIDDLTALNQTVATTLETQGPTNLGNDAADAINLVGILRKDSLTLIDAGRVLANVTANTGILTAGTLPVARGGTSLSSVGTNGQVLTVVTGAPAWANLPPSVTDHGALTGLTPDDDHPHYALADKTRPSPWVAAGDLTARSLADLGTRTHNLLTGLTSDDHTIYLLASGARDLAGDLLPDGTGTRSLGSATRIFSQIFANTLSGGGTNTTISSPVGGDVILDPATGIVAPLLADDNTIDLGVASTRRFRTGYFGTSLVVGASTTYADGSVSTTAGDYSINPAGVNVTLNGKNLISAAISAALLTSGTLPDARFPATLPAASGVNLTSLNASNLGSGTVPDARLSTNIAFLGGRAGGQTLIGGQGAGEDLVLRGTTDVTPGDVIIHSTSHLDMNGRNIITGNNATFAGTVVGGLFSGSGASLTTLNASNLSSGTVADARLTANVSLLDAAQTFSASKTLADAVNIILGTTTGSKIGTSATQKLGFWDAVPVVRQAALTAADATAIDATYDAVEQAVLENLRTRVNELEARMKSYGFLPP